MPTVLENNIRRSNKEREQKARARMLTRLLTIRFGELPAGIVERIRSGTEADHDRWAERLLTTPSLDAIFASPAS